MKVTLPHLHELKLAGTPIAMVAAYDYPGGRIVATLAKMLAQRGSGRGLVSICAAGGQGVVAILERPEQM